jgi:hypothetical protein
LANALQEQYNVLQQSVREIHIKINLLNENDNIIDNLEGITIDGSLEITNSSSNRRTGNLKMVLNNGFIKKYNSLLWLNKRVQIIIGIKNFAGNIIWFNQGRYAVSECSFTKNNTEQSASFTLLDYMALCDGSLGGKIPSKILIAANDITIRQWLISLFKDIGGITKLAIEDVVLEGVIMPIPYKIEKEPNSTIYDISKELTNLYMGQELYFEDDGYLKHQRIKNLKNDMVTWDFSQDKKNLIISCENKTDFKNLYNSITVWGNTNSTTDAQVSWTYRNKYQRNTITIMNSITDKVTGDICYVSELNKSYVWDTTWVLLDFNVIPDFNIETIGLKTNSFSEDKIFTLEQSKLKAEYELWKASNFNENISITCVPIYLLTVNKKILVNMPEIDVSGEYQINSITPSLKHDGTMQIQASKIYY